MSILLSTCLKALNEIAYLTVHVVAIWELYYKDIMLIFLTTFLFFDIFYPSNFYLLS